MQGHRFWENVKVSWAKLTITEFLDRAASKESVPGGGAISSVGGALGVSMALMAARFTTGKRYENVKDRIETIIGELDALMHELVALADRDSAAFEAVGRAYGLKKDDPTREETMQNALVAAEEPPFLVLRAVARAMTLVRELFPLANKNLLSDVAVAAHLLRAAFKGAQENVYVNLAGMKDEEFKKNRLRDIEDLERASVQNYIAVSGEYARRMNEKLGRTCSCGED